MYRSKDKLFLPLRGVLYKNVPDGFEYRQYISFEFFNDNRKLSKAVSNIIGCNIEPGIVFSYRSSRYEEAKNDALAKAVENARKEAEIIVTAAGAKLGKLLDINMDHNHFERDFRKNDVLCDCKCNSSEIYIDVEPEDESIHQDVNMVWEIEG